jgi:2-polyprenyl-3-methyl-5-hydroxy-6-metoxy-1,4-benzoquinol methylase
VYVGTRRDDFTFSGHDPARSSALAGRVKELELVQHDVEQAEQPLRVEADRERLARLRRHIGGGSLLDVGSATGSFLDVARGAFEVVGVEPDPATSEQARAGGHAVTTGTLDDLVAPAGGFDAITMFHVVEHLDSPRRALERTREFLRPGGIVLIETPTVDCLWFKLAPRRWRQLIPDHYYFFERATLERLLRDRGFEPVDYEKVGRRVSLRFVADRLRRSGLPLSAALQRGTAALGLERRTVRLNPGDIMSVSARAR